MVEQIIAAAQWNCKYCGQTMHAAQLSTHLVVCISRPIKCPDCGSDIVPNELAEHYRENPEHTFKVARKAPGSNWIVQSICETLQRDSRVGPPWEHTLITDAISNQVDDKVISGLHLCWQLEGTNELVFLQVRFSPHQKGVCLLSAYHTHQSHLCKLTMGEENSELRMSFAFESRTLHHFKKRFFKSDDMKENVPIFIEVAERAAENEDLTLGIQVFP